MTGSEPSGLNRWLADIPRPEDAIVVLEGREAIATADRVSLIVDKTRLSFAIEDVVRVKSGLGPELHRDTVVVHVGAMLIAAQRIDSDPARTRRPFALQVRPKVPVAVAAPTFEAAERRFLAANRIVD